MHRSRIPPWGGPSPPCLVEWLCIAANSVPGSAFPHSLSANDGGPEEKRGGAVPRARAGWVHGSALLCLSCLSACLGVAESAGSAAQGTRGGTPIRLPEPDRLGKPRAAALSRSPQSFRGYIAYPSWPIGIPDCHSLRNHPFGTPRARSTIGSRGRSSISLWPRRQCPGSVPPASLRSCCNHTESYCIFENGSAVPGAHLVIFD